MRLCLFTSSFPQSLANPARATFFLDAIAALRARGHTVHVLTQAPGSAEFGERGFEVTRFPWPGSGSDAALTQGLSVAPLRAAPRLASYLWAATRALRKLHARERFDAVICGWAVPAGICARAAGTPYVVWCLGSDINMLKKNVPGRALLRWILRGAGARFADGLALTDDVARISGLSCEFLPSFRALPTAPRRESVAPSQEPTLLFIGRHDPVKGIDLLVDAFAQVPFPNLRLRIVGDGPLGSTLRRRAGELSLGERVAFLGVVSEERLSQELAAATAIVIPSRSESIPLVLGEAMQAGKPVIATDVGDLGRLLREHGVGVVASEPSAPAITEAITRYFKAPPAWNEAGAQALLERLSFAKALPRLEHALERLRRC